MTGGKEKINEIDRLDPRWSLPRTQIRGGDDNHVAASEELNHQGKLLKGMLEEF